MIKFLAGLLFLFLTSSLVIGQATEERPIDMGIELQQYPTGFLPGIRMEYGFHPKQSLHLRLGGNIFDHQNFGVQEEETGSGFGFTLGYQYYLKNNHKGFYLGARSDFWFNKVDWVQNGNGNQVRGTSDIVVVQPTGILGYLFLLNEKFVISPQLGLGFEINVRTIGAETGQGLIALWGLNLGYRI